MGRLIHVLLLVSNGFLNCLCEEKLNLMSQHNASKKTTTSQLNVYKTGFSVRHVFPRDIVNEGPSPSLLTCVSMCGRDRRCRVVDYHIEKRNCIQYNKYILRDITGPNVFNFDLLVKYGSCQPPVITGAYISSATSTHVGSNITYQCRPGFTFCRRECTATITCLPNQQWTKPRPCYQTSFRFFNRVGAGEHIALKCPVMDGFSVLVRGRALGSFKFQPKVTAYRFAIVFESQDLQIRNEFAARNKKLDFGISSGVELRFPLQHNKTQLPWTFDDTRLVYEFCNSSLHVSLNGIKITTFEVPANISINIIKIESLKMENLNVSVPYCPTG